MKTILMPGESIQKDQSEEISKKFDAQESFLVFLKIWVRYVFGQIHFDLKALKSFAIFHTQNTWILKDRGKKRKRKRLLTKDLLPPSKWKVNLLSCCSQSLVSHVNLLFCLDGLPSEERGIRGNPCRSGLASSYWKLEEKWFIMSINESAFGTRLLKECWTISERRAAVIGIKKYRCWGVNLLPVYGKRLLPREWITQVWWMAAFKKSNLSCWIVMFIMLNCKRFIYSDPLSLKSLLFSPLH